MQKTLVPFLAALPTLLPAAVFLIPLGWRRRGQMFTMAVQPEFLESSEAVRIRRTYRTLVTALGLLAYAGCVASLLRSSSSLLEWVLVLAPIAEVVGLGVTWGWAWNRTIPHRLAHPVVRTASLTAQPEGGAAWWLSTLTAWLPLALTAWVLSARWASIPARFATHWGTDGVANGWTTRSASGVYWPLVLAAFLILMMSGMGYGITRYSSGNSGALRRMTRNLLRMVCWLMGFLFSMIGLLPLLPHPETTMVWVMLSGALFAIATVAFAMTTILQDKNFDTMQNATSEMNWKWGIIYYNSTDAALFVPKRLGYGYTFNFARPAAWMIVAGFVVIALLPLVFVHNHRH